MNRLHASLLVVGLTSVALAAFFGSAQPCAASLYQDPPPDDPAARDREKPMDEPPLDEPPLDEPRGRGRRHLPGMRGDGPGMGRDADRPGRGRGMEDEGDRFRRREEMIERFIGIIREKLPDHYERLERMRNGEPERFVELMRRLRPVVREYLDLVEEEPELANTIFEDFRIDERLRDLSVAYRAASERKNTEQADQIEQEIRNLVKQQAEMSIARREARLRIAEQRLNEQVERLRRHRERFEQERSRMEEFVNDRANDVMLGRPPCEKPPHGDDGFGRGGRGREGQNDARRKGNEGRRDRRDRPGRRMRDRRDAQPAPQPEQQHEPDHTAGDQT